MAEGRSALRLARARKALRAAKVLLERDLFVDSVSRAYYAVFHAAKGALASVGVQTHTHSGLREMFCVHLVQPGRMEGEFARILTEEQRDAKTADDGLGVQVEKARAEQRVSEAEKFVQRIEQYLRTAAQA